MSAIDLDYDFSPNTGEAHSNISVSREHYNYTLGYMLLSSNDYHDMIPLDSISAAVGMLFNSSEGIL